MSRLVIGTAQWGSDYGIANTSGIPDDDECRAILSLAASKGVDVLDTARAYGNAENRVGKFAGEGWKVATKTDPSASSLADMRSSLEMSLRCLDRERVDWLLLHRPGQKHADGGSCWRYLQSQVAIGRIGKAGVSVISVAQARRELQPDIGAIQVPASLSDRRLRSTNFFEEAASEGIEVFVRSVFLQGALLIEPSRLPPRLSRLNDGLSAVRRWAREQGRPLVEIFLGYVRDAIPSARVVVGVESPSQLRQVLDAWVSPAFSTTHLHELETLMPMSEEDVLNPAEW